MTIDQLYTIIGIVGSVIGSAGWLHGSLNKVHTDVRVLSEKLDGFSYRIKRLEDIIENARKEGKL
jgi:hypothetical protein